MSDLPRKHKDKTNKSICMHIYIYIILYKRNPGVPALGETTVTNGPVPPRWVVPGSFWGLERLHAPLQRTAGAAWTPKTPPRRSQNAPRRFQDASGSSKTPPRRHKLLPRCLNDPPGSPQDTPRLIFYCSAL